MSSNDLSARRARQEDLGLFLFTEPVTQPEKKDDIMQETTTNTGKPSRAETVLRHLQTPPTFKEVAVHELKKAAIWAPILLSTLAGAIWMNKRLVLKAATRV